jgi:hypothetical protein
VAWLTTVSAYCAFDGCCPVLSTFISLYGATNSINRTIVNAPPCTFICTVAIWDVDEFFIPKGDNKDIIDIIKKALPPPSVQSELGQVLGSSMKSGAKKQVAVERGYGHWVRASGDNHPHCFLQLSERVIARSPTEPSTTQLARSHGWDRLWVGRRFAHGVEPPSSHVGQQFSFKKAIVPTKTMYQIGLHMSGACRLEWPWNGCANASEEFCLGHSIERNSNSAEFDIYRGRGKPKTHAENPPVPLSTHFFDEVVLDVDTRVIDPDSEGVIYHVQAFRDVTVSNKVMIKATAPRAAVGFRSVTSTTSSSTTSALRGMNDYSLKFFPNTMKALRERNLDLLVDLPEFLRAQTTTAASGWVDYKRVYESRRS